MQAVQLQKSVQNQLGVDPRLDSSKIGVAADESGIVTLSGSVSSYTQKVEAEAAAKLVYGVRGLANKIEVRPGATPRVPIPRSRTWPWLPAKPH